MIVVYPECCVQVPPEYGNVLEVSYDLPGYLATGVSGYITVTFTPKVRSQQRRILCWAAHERLTASCLAMLCLGTLPRMLAWCRGEHRATSPAAHSQANEDIETHVAMLAETGPFEVCVQSSLGGYAPAAHLKPSNGNADPSSKFCLKPFPHCDLMQHLGQIPFPCPSTDPHQVLDQESCHGGFRPHPGLWAGGHPGRERHAGQHECAWADAGAPMLLLLMLGMAAWFHMSWRASDPAAAPLLPGSADAHAVQRGRPGCGV